MNSLFMAMVELMLDDLLKQYNYKIDHYAGSPGISTKTLYRKLHKKNKGKSHKGS